MKKSLLCLIFFVLSPFLVFSADWSLVADNKNYTEALEYCSDLVEGGYSWKLPSISELSSSLINSGEFWAKDSSPDPNQAPYFNFSSRKRDYDYKNTRKSVVCIKKITKQTKNAAPAQKSQQEEKALEEYNTTIMPVFNKCDIAKSSEQLESCMVVLNNLLPAYSMNKAKVKDKIDTIKQKNAEFEKREQYLKGRKIGNLFWSDRSSKEMTWYSAKEYCENLTEGGFDDWRLPNIDELRTTIKNCSKTQTDGQCKASEKSGCLSNSCDNPIGSCFCDRKENNGGYYSKLGDNDEVLLWSSSSDYFAWIVNFYDGHVFLYDKSVGNICSVRCVRE